MLLSKTVMIKWHNKNKQWYEEKGYKFTKLGDEFEIKVEDLTNKSSGLVNVKCDCEDCKNPYLKPMKWSNYILHLHDEKYNCNLCIKKISKIKEIKTRLKNTKSFEEWCIKNDRQDILDRWDYILNKLNPSEITYSSSKKYWFKCPKGLHNSELKKINDFINGHNGTMDCKYCNSFAQWGINNIGDDFLVKYWSDKNTLNPWDISVSSRKKVWIKCNEKNYHEDYEVVCFEFSQRNSRCPYCNNKKVHPNDSLGKLLEDRELLHIWSDKNKKSPFKYSKGSSKKVWWKCENGKHDDYLRDSCSSNNYNFRCPQCIRTKTESFLQEKVRLYLQSLNKKIYTILHEDNCTIVPINPKTNRVLPFDNEIKELKLICEVHGKQHYEITGFEILHSKQNNTTPKQELHYQQLKDRYKKIKAIQQGYYYLEIPYWTDDKQETWKQLIDNKINEILNLKEVI